MYEAFYFRLESDRTSSKGPKPLKQRAAFEWTCSYCSSLQYVSIALDFNWTVLLVRWEALHVIHAESFLHSKNSSVHRRTRGWEDLERGKKQKSTQITERKTGKGTALKKTAVIKALNKGSEYLCKLDISILSPSFQLYRDWSG